MPLAVLTACGNTLFPLPIGLNSPAVGIWIYEVWTAISNYRTVKDLNVSFIPNSFGADFKFYSLIPSYLRNKRKLRKSSILTLEQKRELIGGV